MLIIIRKLITETLRVLYESFWPTVIISVLLMVTYMYAEKHGGLMATIKDWLQEFRKSVQYRRIFALSVCVSFILVSTLLKRSYWSRPLSKVFSSWRIVSEDGTWTVDPIENTVLFIPFIVTLFWTMRDRVLKDGRLVTAVRAAVKYAFGFSLLIETLQLILYLGTFQVSDLFYNTFGGLLGGVIYWCGYKVNHRDKEFINED